VAVPNLHAVGLFQCAFHHRPRKGLTNTRLQVAPPDPSYPRIVSHVNTLPYVSKICRQVGHVFTCFPHPSSSSFVNGVLPTHSRYFRSGATGLTVFVCAQAFPPGEYFAIPAEPDVASVNKMGGWNVSADRLAFIDGQKDPWRPVTAHSLYGAAPRTSSAQRPYHLIPGGVHHWDEVRFSASSGQCDLTCARPERARELDHGALRDQTDSRGGGGVCEAMAERVERPGQELNSCIVVFSY
jgi:hypothetical protein